MTTEESAIVAIREVLGDLREWFATGDDDRPDPDVAIIEIEITACEMLAGIAERFGHELAGAVADEAYATIRAANRWGRRTCPRFTMPGAALQ